MAEKCYYPDVTEAEFFEGNSVLKKKLCTIRGFQKPPCLLSATEIIDHSISNKTNQTVSSHFDFIAQTEHCNAFVESLAGNCFQYFFPWWLKEKERWKQFSSTCSRSYENLVLQNQNRKLNLAWHYCYKIDVLGVSGQAEEEPGWLSDQRRASRTPQTEKVSACINIAMLLPAVFLFDYSSNTRCYSICN